MMRFNFTEIPAPLLRESYLLGEPWMFYVFMFVGVLIAGTQWNYSKNIREIFYAVINIRMLREILREEIVLTSRTSQLLIVLSHISLAVFFYLALSLYEIGIAGVSLSGFLKYLLILTIITFIYFVKIIIIRGMRLLFNGDYSLREYEFNYGLLLKIAGIGLFPISLLLAYSKVIPSDVLVVLGLILIVASVVWRWARGWLNAVTNRISIVYIILYLCTLEILPAVVLLKVLLVRS
ncbi:MAG: DUF4271 domain-containing protein [Flavobacteriales bacterium]|jgi:hypothetical protein|tara:strand:+ start:614 stop:1321 length:708 start_codon:yes stop_codon:yes gene_type:complete